MKWLEHKIPPPLVGALVAVVMWFAAPVGPTLALNAGTRDIIATALFIAALAFDVSGLLAMRACRTTINPLSPQRATRLVTGGVYRLTRNPMYVGMGCMLLAWAVFLSAALAFVGPILFVVYMNRFQVLPEERVLRQLFGEQYIQYTTRVRRWL